MNEHSEGGFPLAYLITIRTYGTWLHGDENGSVDRHGFNVYGNPRIAPSEKLKDFMRQEMKQTAFILDKHRRICVLDAVREVCDYRGYELLAVNIRSNHLHAVISAMVKPEKIANDFKTYATRKLRSEDLAGSEQSVWARGKSCRYLWKPNQVERAMDYVLFGQGEEIPEFDLS